MLLFLFLLWPIAELVVIILVAEQIGILLTLLLLIASFPLGILATRSQGRAVVGRMSQTVNEGRMPTREVLDGALVVLGGILLMIPGFISDIVGIVLLLPLTRAPLRHAFARNLNSPIVTQTVQFTTRGRAYDVDSTASDVDSTGSDVDSTGSDVDSNASDVDSNASDVEQPRLGR
jgi:UPF0716 protein FxsA